MVTRFKGNGVNFSIVSQLRLKSQSYQRCANIVDTKPLVRSQRGLSKTKNLNLSVEVICTSQCAGNIYNLKILSDIFRAPLLNQPNIDTESSSYKGIIREIRIHPSFCLDTECFTSLPLYTTPLPARLSSTLIILYRSFVMRWDVLHSLMYTLHTYVFRNPFVKLLSKCQSM